MKQTTATEALVFLPPRHVSASASSNKKGCIKISSSRACTCQAVLHCSEVLLDCGVSIIFKGSQLVKKESELLSVLFYLLWKGKLANLYWWQGRSFLLCAVRGFKCIRQSEFGFLGDFWERIVEISDKTCLLYTSPSPRDATLSRMPSSA